MPIALQINHPDRMVVGIAEGVVSRQDLDGFVEELGRVSAFRYRKLIDLMAASWGVSEEELTAFSESVRQTPRERPSGPIALVTNDANGPLARLFAELTGTKRPARVFDNIHAARRWLLENSLKA